LAPWCFTIQGRCLFSEPEISLLNEVPAYSQARARHAVIGNKDNPSFLEGILETAARFQRHRFVVAFDAQDGPLPDAGQLGEFSLTDIEGDTSRPEEFIGDIHDPILAVAIPVLQMALAAIHRQIC
jgi:hypothetical protein